MVRYHWFIIWMIGIAFVGSIGSCMPPEEERDAEDILLAKVYNKPLYLSDLDGMIPRSATPTDSSLIVNSFTERWVRENLMLYEAERNIPKDLNIDKLVRDYRASLILHNYEKQITETQLDSMISDDEIMEYYNQYEGHFQLETSIMRCKFMKLPSDAPDLAKAEKMWEEMKDGSSKKLENYCEENAITYQLEDSIWVNKDELASEFPKDVLSSMKEGKEFKQKKEDYVYYVRVMEVQSKNNEPPLSYIRNQVSKFILHNRKLELVNKMREELYQKAERKGHVKYYN